MKFTFRTINFSVLSVQKLGTYILNNIEALGSIFLFSNKFIFWSFRKPFRVRLLFEQLFFIGNKSVFIVCLAGAFSGMVMAYQTYFGFKLISVDSLVGPVVAISLAKELAPVLTGLIVAGRAGAAMAAQIGTMKVTEQIDALEVMGINAFQYLVVPRIWASLFALPMLSSIFLLVGSVGAWIVGTQSLMIDEAIFYSKLSNFMYVQDIFQGIIKSFFFGLIISVIGTYFGFKVDKGAEGVGRGTNLAVVWGMISVLVSDYFLTSYLVRVL